MMIGVNTFGLAKCIQVDKLGTFEKLKKMGVKNIELLITPSIEQGEHLCVELTKENFLTFINECERFGMKSTSAHVFSGSGDDLKNVTEYLLWVCKNSNIRQFVFSSFMDTKEKVEAQAKFMCEIAKILKSENAIVVYHNHVTELLPLLDDKEKIALDYFFEICTEEILLQFDMGWAGIAGNELELALHFKDRICSLHCKDFIPGTKGTTKKLPFASEKFAAIGSGEIKTSEVIAMRTEFPKFTGEIVIDQDDSCGDFIEDLRNGLCFLQDLMV